MAVIEAATVTGPAKNLVRFAKLARGAADVSIATFCRNTSNAFIEAARKQGIEVQVIPERRVFDWRALGFLRRAVTDYNPDVLQTHGVKSHFLVRLTKLDRHYPWIAFHHGYTSEDLKMHAYNQLDRWSLRAARRVVTVCAPFAKEMQRTGVPDSRIEIIPNSVEPFVQPDSKDTEHLRARLALEPGERIIVAIGRLSPEKGHMDLLQAAAEIAKSGAELRFCLVIAGDGPERGRLEEAAKKLGQRVVMMGHMQDVRALYAIADVFVLPSHSEGSSNVLLEAMAAGIPIVATSVGGVPETVANEASALICEPRQPTALATQIIRLLKDGALASRLRSEALAQAAARTPEAYRDAILRIYEAAGGAGNGN